MIWKDHSWSTEHQLKENRENRRGQVPEIFHKESLKVL